MSPQIHGVIPYLVSPIGDNGTVLERPLRNLARQLVSAGVHGLTPLGSTGEFAYLTVDQRMKIVEIVVDEVAGSVPVLPGVAAASTFDAVRQAERLVDLGCDGLVVMMTPYFPPSQRSIGHFFTDIARSVDRPIVVYTNPPLQGYTITLSALANMVEVPNIRYIKDASGTTSRLQTLRREFGDRLGVFAASAHLPVPVLQLGGLGIMSGPACLAPTPWIDLYESVRSGNTERALRVQADLSVLSDLFLKHSLAACVKNGLTQLGHAVGDPIPPQDPLDAKAVAELKDALEGIGRAYGVLGSDAAH